ncbi:MFS transporter [Glutamicibacter sp. Je.9.36]|uniref:MFS transporter n=1 Tax=Glutamicibacter sp. Je.9.36 TaxID=3142837 RepID=UPI003DA8805B
MALAASENKTKRRAWYVGVVAGMASYIDAAAIVSNGIALVLYQGVMGLSDLQFGILSAALTFGIAVGALAGGRLGDRFGRRVIFIVTMAMIVLGSLLNVLAPDFTVLLLGVVMVGLGAGADLPVSLATIAESSTDKNRGAIIGFSHMLWSIGVLATTILSSIVGGMGHLGGQALYAHVGIVAFVVLLLRFTIPESEEWLAARQHKNQSGGTPLEAQAGSLKLLLSPPFARPFIALIGFYALVNLAANTGGQFGTKIAVEVVGLSVQQSSLIGLAFFPLAIVAGLWFMKIVGTPRRMAYFVSGAVLLVASNFIPVIFGFTVPVFIVSGLFSLFGMAFAFEAIMKVWTQESFPTLLRASAQGTILAIARFAAGTLAFVTPGLLGSLGPSGLYILLGTVTAAGLVMGWWGFRARPATRREAGEGCQSEPAKY